MMVPTPVPARPVFLVVVLGVAIALGCHGQIESPTVSNEEPPVERQPVPGRVATDGSAPARLPRPDPEKAMAGPQSCQAPSPGRSPLRRLSRFEYNNTVRDLLGDTSRPADRFPAEEAGNGFGNDADSLGVSRLLLESYAATARTLAAKAVATTDTLTRVVGCDPGRDETACARFFIEHFGRRIYRRPLEPFETDSLAALFTRGRTAGGFKAGVETVIEVALQSPQFLYRAERGQRTPGTAVLTPTGFEMASRLSFTLWGSMPDSALFSAAENGNLKTSIEVLAQAERMLDDPRAREQVAHFHDSLFELDGLDELDKPPGAFARFTAGMGVLFREETRRFIDHVVWQGAGDLGTMLTASYSFANASLAAFYGIAGVTGSAFQRIEHEPGRRAGFITQSGILSHTTPGTTTNPVLRGKFVRLKLLCDAPPDPPPALMIEEPPHLPGLTNRERFARHSSDAACRGCHALLDPLGFALENFDGVGLWRSSDAGKPIDARVELLGTDVDGPLDGPVDLMKRLAASSRVRSCLVGQWMTYAFGRAESAEDRCTRALLERAFAASGHEIRALITALTQTDAFLYRAISSP